MNLLFWISLFIICLVIGLYLAVDQEPRKLKKRNRIK